jgi:hypothetical protein
LCKLLEECMFSSKILRSKSNRIIVWKFWGSIRICNKKIDYTFCSKNLKNNNVWQKHYVKFLSSRKFDIIIVCVCLRSNIIQTCVRCVCVCVFVFNFKKCFVVDERDYWNRRDCCEYHVQCLCWFLVWVTLMITQNLTWNDKYMPKLRWF